MKKYSVLIRTGIVFLVVFVLNYCLFDKFNLSYIVKAIITFISIYVALYFTKENE